MDCLNYSVYIIRARTMGLIKIGCTGDVSQRLVELQIGSPDELEILWLSRRMSRREAFRAETHLHSKFDAFCVRGEWFFPEEPLLQFIQDLKAAAPLDHTASVDMNHFDSPDTATLRRTLKHREKKYQEGLKAAEVKFYSKKEKK